MQLHIHDRDGKDRTRMAQWIAFGHREEDRDCEK
jgi:hypothetical protein